VNLYRRIRLTLVSGFDHNLLTGEVDGSQRQAMVDDFQNPEGNHFILLVSTLAGGVGLNLTAVSQKTIKHGSTNHQANKVVIFDPAWSKFHPERL
jgi:SNF2 family DNA or RNA helicase